MDDSVLPTGNKSSQKLSKLQQHNARLANQLADANKRISRLRFERSLLLDKLYEYEKKATTGVTVDGNSLLDVEAGWSSESEGEYRECEWWRDVDVAAVLARNPVAALPSTTRGNSFTVPKKGRKGGATASKKRMEMALAMTSEEDLDTENDDYPTVQSSGMLFDFPSTTGSSPPSKKRKSNKASATDAVLKTIPVEYDSENRPVLPLNVGIVTIEALGEIVFDRPTYHNRRYILPVGFHSTRTYLSTVDPNASTVYHSKILDGGAAPVFQVTADDTPGAVFQAPTSTGAWSAVVRAANQIRSRDYSNSGSGPDYYGLSNATVAMLIEDLPNSDRCINYQRKRFERGTAHVKNIMSKKPNEIESDQASGVPSEIDPLDFKKSRFESLLNAASSVKFD